MGSAWRCRLSKDEDLVFQGFRVFGSVGRRVSRLWQFRVVLRFEVCGEVLQEVGFWFSAVAGLEPVLVGQKSGPYSVGWFRVFCCGGVCVMKQSIFCRVRSWKWCCFFFAVAPPGLFRPDVVPQTFFAIV